MMPFSRPKVLVVDDDRELCALVKTFLDANDILTTTLHDGTIAIEYLKRKKPSLIVLDITLSTPPSGIEICTAVRKQSAFDGVPIVIVTGSEYMEDVEKCFAAGANDYIFKPFRPEHLLEKITSLLA